MLFEGDVYQTIVTARFCALKVNEVHKKVHKTFISSCTSHMDYFYGTVLSFNHFHCIVFTCKKHKFDRIV